VASLRHAGADYLASIAGIVRRVRWTARDGLEIEGLVSTPDGSAPFPLVVLVHGGPVWACCERWRWATTTGDVGGEDSHDIVTGVDALVAEISLGRPSSL
jgi:hypothetical protein